MQPARNSAARSLAALLLAAQLFIAALAISPDLHHWLHSDAGDSDHQCAITAMTDGQCDRPDIGTPLARPLQYVVADKPLSFRSEMPASPLRLPDGRAPPCA